MFLVLTVRGTVWSRENWINSNVKAKDLFFRHVNPYGVSCDEKGQCGFAMGSRGSIKDYEQLITTLKSKGIKALFAGHNQAFYDGICDGLRFIDTGTLGKRENEFLPGHPQFLKQAFVWVDVMTDGKLIVNFYVYENGKFSLFNKQLFPDKVEAKKVNRGKHYEGVAATCISVKDQDLPKADPAKPSSPQPFVTKRGSSACAKRPDQNCKDIKRCKQIDQAWLQVSYLIDGPLSGRIFDTGTNTAELFDTTYCVSKPGKKIQSPKPSVHPKLIIPGKTKGMGLSGLTEGCKLTPPPAEDTQAIGSPTCGYLENGIKTSTTSFSSFCKMKGYSTKTGKKDEEVCYATIELIQTLELASCAMKKLHGKRFLVKDRSYPRGGACYNSKVKAEEKPPEEFCKLKSGRGAYSFHSSHQNGLDADVGIYYDPGGGLTNNLWNMFKEGRVSSMFNNKKALQANWDFLKIISSVYDIQLIFLDQQLIDLIEKHAKSKGEWETYKDKINLRHEPDHKNHYHVRIKCPKNDLKCEGSRSTMDKPTGNIKITEPDPKSMVTIPPKDIIQLTGTAALDPLKSDCSAAEIKKERNKKYKELCKKDYSAGFEMDEAHLFEYYKTHYIINQKLLREIHLKNQVKTKLYNLGNSVKGNPILALQITNPSTGYKPPIFVNCAHHSDERIAPEYCYQIINDLLTVEKNSYLDYFDFWVVPIVNVDQRLRFNINNVNLNRNYPFRWGIRDRYTYRPGKNPASEPETKAIMNLFNQKHFVYAISVHAPSNKIVYGYTSPKTKDPEPHFQKAFAKVMHEKSISSKGKKYDLRKDVYPVSGADQDWYQAEHGAIAILVEAPENKKYEETRKIVNDYMPGFWATLDYYQSLPKLRVKVVDSENKPVVAKVMAKELKYFNGEEFHTDSVYGIREIIFLNEGVYTIDVEKGGKTKSINYNVQSGTQEEVITLT